MFVFCFDVFEIMHKKKDKINKLMWKKIIYTYVIHLSHFHQNSKTNGNFRLIFDRKIKRKDA